MRETEIDVGLRLPPGLTAWGAELSQLPSDLVEALEPWLVRLSAALGPLTPRAEPGRGPPNGYDGLTRRGPYDRLLTSEWMLAEHYPEEFIRRAAHGEHLFLQLAEESTAPHHRAVVLFDAGPAQVGAPRLAHLAFLLTAAFRARRAGVELRWRALQDVGRGYHEDVDDYAVIGLLESRSVRPADPSMLEDALSHLAGGPKPREDLWLVGGPGLARLAPTGARLARVQEPLTLGDRRVQMTLISPGRPEVQLELPTPPNPIAIRLLRNPFEVQTQPVARPTIEADGPRQLSFSVDGRTLFIRGMAALVAQPMPAGGHDIGLPRTLSMQGYPPIAVGRVGRELVLVVVKPEHITLLRYTRRGRFQNATHLPRGSLDGDPWAGGALRRLSPCLPLGGSRSAWLICVDGLGRAIRLPRDGALPAEPLLDGVLGLWRTNGRTAIVLEPLPDGATRTVPLVDHIGRPVEAERLPRPGVIWLDSRGRLERQFALTEGDGDLAVRFAEDLVAVRTDPSAWTLCTPYGTFEVEVGPGRVLGASRRAPEGRYMPGLWVLDADGRAVRHYERGGQGKLLGHAQEPLRTVAMEPIRGRIVSITAQNTLRIEDIERQHVLLESSLGGG